MGLFDRWRRKKDREVTIRLQEPEKVLISNSEIDTENTHVQSENVDSLVREYESLIARREELQIERNELTERLDRGEIDNDEFREQLMLRIQEAAMVSENLRITSSKLTSLGYRGVLH
ncbi:MAG: hypothetical protein JW779_01850 [Candidatus Thorarchaeota archaeon]|nr:hypothetical protein [Candidatus Thorarchaeota archaeon]